MYVDEHAVFKVRGYVTRPPSKADNYEGVGNSEKIGTTSIG